MHHVMENFPSGGRVALHESSRTAAQPQPYVRCQKLAQIHFLLIEGHHCVSSESLFALFCSICFGVQTSSTDALPASYWRCESIKLLDLNL